MKCITFLESITDKSDFLIIPRGYSCYIRSLSLMKYVMSFNQSFNDFWTCNPQSAQSRGMDQQHKSTCTSSQFLVSILLVKLIIISVLLWLLWIDATWMPMQFSWPEWFFKTIPVRYWSGVTSLGLLDLIIERTCLQTVYAQENYALDSQRRFHQI